jgi:hypothetical protein
MSAAEALLPAPADTLPLPLRLTLPEPVEFSPLEALAEEERARAAEYDPVLQMGRYDITMGGTKCSGVCCSSVGGIDISVRDQVKDDK